MDRFRGLRDATLPPSSRSASEAGPAGGPADGESTRLRERLLGGRSGGPEPSPGNSRGERSVTDANPAEGQRVPGLGRSVVPGANAQNPAGSTEAPSLGGRRAGNEPPVPPQTPIEPPRNVRNGAAAERGGEAGSAGPAGRPRFGAPHESGPVEAGKAAPDAGATRLRERLLGGRGEPSPRNNAGNSSAGPPERRVESGSSPAGGQDASNQTVGKPGAGEANGPAGRGTPGHPDLIIRQPREGEKKIENEARDGDRLPTPLRGNRGDGLRQPAEPGDRGPGGNRTPGIDRGPHGNREPVEKGPLGIDHLPKPDRTPGEDRIPGLNRGPGGDRGPGGNRGPGGDIGPGGDHGRGGELGRLGPRGELEGAKAGHRFSGPPSKFAQRVESGELQKVVRGETAAKLKLEEQYRLAARGGDYARRLELHKNVERITQINKTNITNITNVTNINSTQVNVHLGGRPYYYGRVAPHYHRDCFEWHYWGHSFFAGVCWYPRWTPWVRWSWYYTCEPVWDPRPIWCRPIVYVPAPVWVYYPVPVWQPLPECESGTWVDVAKVDVGPRPDVQLLAVRLVDPGHPDEKLGPRYRVWIRNNGDVDINQPFNVVALTSLDGRVAAGLPQAGVRVQAVRAGETQSFDIRLPVECYAMGRDDQGKAIPFATLHVIADADRELAEATRTNNGANIAREKIFPVDPAVFGVDPKEAVEGGEVVIAGEGLGPQPGQVLVNIDGAESEAEIVGWFDLGVRVVLPKLPAGAGRREVQLIVIRGDGAAANPIGVMVAPAPGAAMGPRPQAVEPREPQAGPVFPQ